MAWTFSKHFTRDGSHLAAWLGPESAGRWLGGMRTGDGGFAFASRMCGANTTMLMLRYRGRWLRVTAGSCVGLLRVEAGQALQLAHYATTLTLMRSAGLPADSSAGARMAG
jgi:hypothetical protein